MKSNEADWPLFRWFDLRAHCSGMEPPAVPTAVEPAPYSSATEWPDVDFIRDLDIRRAMLAVLLAADRELGSADVVQQLRAVHGIELEGRQKATPRQRVSDTLRSLERRGWCRRVRRGRYVAVPSAMSPSRRWRSINWRRPTVRDRRR